PAGKVVALDVFLPNIESPSNLTLVQVDQRDRDKLAEICAKHAPDGFDVIIDDASHVGAWSAITFEALFPHLKHDGLYFIEDWATGYMPDFPDGAELKAPQALELYPSFHRRIASHDYGMVGFVKSLVDRQRLGVFDFKSITVQDLVVTIRKF